MNRTSRRLSERQQQRQIAKAAKRPWEPMQPVPESEWPEYRGRRRPVAFWRNNRFTAIEYPPRHTEYGDVRHLAIQRTTGERVSRWTALQRVKDETVGEDNVAIEVYPRNAEIVEDCHVYHLWVLPQFYPLPGVGFGVLWSTPK